MDYVQQYWARYQVPFRLGVETEKDLVWWIKRTIFTGCILYVLLYLKYHLSVTYYLSVYHRSSSTIYIAIVCMYLFKYLTSSTYKSKVSFLFFAKEEIEAEIFKTVVKAHTNKPLIGLWSYLGLFDYIAKVSLIIMGNWEYIEKRNKKE